MVLAETWNRHCLSHLSLNSELIFMKSFFHSKGDPKLFENAGVQSELNCSDTNTGSNITIAECVPVDLCIPGVL